MPRLAVVIPVHDGGSLVLEAVDSIREDEAVEVVVVDDGSSDPATLAALAALRERGVRVVTQENGGPGAARMTGVWATIAPFVFPLDADDLLEPGALSRLADLLEADPDAAFAWGDYRIFGDYEGHYRAPSTFLPWTLTWVNPYPACSLVRRAALDRAEGWQPRGYEDWSLWLRFVELGLHGVAHPGVVYHRRLEGGGGVVVADRARHQQLYAALEHRHPDAFGRRRELVAVERPPRWKRLVFPILFGRRAVVPLRVEAWMQRTMMRRSLRLAR